MIFLIEYNRISEEGFMMVIEGCKVGMIEWIDMSNCGVIDVGKNMINLSEGYILRKENLLGRLDGELDKLKYINLSTNLLNFFVDDNYIGWKGARILAKIKWFNLETL